MLHVQPMQQRDQARPALVGNAKFLLNPGANLASRPRQRLGDSSLQLVLLVLTQTARAAFVTEARQPLYAIFLIQAMPGPDGIVVEQ